MTHENRNPETELERAIHALRNDQPDAKEIESAGTRAWARIQSAGGAVPALEQIRGCDDIRALLPAYRVGKLNPARALLVQDHLRECVACHRLAQSKAAPEAGWTPVAAPAHWSTRRWAMAAAMLVAVGALALFVDLWYFAAPAGVHAKVQSVDGSAYALTSAGERVLKPGDELVQGDLIRTAAGGHAFVQLSDGSLVEMNERTEFFIKARRKDTTINLDQGDVIVQAAKRRSGHLYVITPDCRVAVTGTVFSVNSGMKGSRVAVIEGVVRVAEAGKEQELRAGDQLATGGSLQTVALRDEISWSRNLDKHLALLGQFATLQKKLEQIPEPGLRFSSTILQRIPENTVVYAAVPNLGDALSEANRIFQEQLRQSATLREWWYKGHQQNDGPTMEQIVEKIHVLSQYLGDEIVLVSLGGPSGGESNAAVIAEVRREGLADYLRTDFAQLSGPHNGQGGIRVITPAQLASLSPAQTAKQGFALVRPDFVVFGGSVTTLQLLNARLNNGSSAFEGSEFGQRIESAYRQGAGFLLAVDLQRIIENSQRNRPRTAAQRRSDFQFDRTGFRDARYLLVSHRDLSGTPDNRALIEFAGERHGIASWLAPPAPMGSLEFVSPNAGVAFSAVVKNPALMVDDILQISGKRRSEADFAKLDSDLNLDLRNDLAASLGGEFALALDGPLLPTPSWKLIAEVTDQARLQSSIERLIAAANREAAKTGKPGAQLQRQEANGQTFYLLQRPTTDSLNSDVYYTFAGSYMIVAPSRALLMSALQTRSGQGSLPRSGEFRALLPKDGYTDFSAVLYQNLGPMVQPIASQLSAQQQQALQQLIGDSKPAVICAYGEPNRIQVASASKLSPFDWNLMALSTLLNTQRAGTSGRLHP